MFKLNNGVELTTMQFPAGETFVKIADGDKVTQVIWYYEGDHELVQLGLILDLCDNVKEVIIPYFPHARQDRYTSSNQPLSLRVFIDMLLCIDRNKDIFWKVVDPHSCVVEFLFDNRGNGIDIVHQWSFADTIKNLGKYDAVIAPDKGAVDKAAEWAKVLGTPLITADKVRNPDTGYISSYELNACQEEVYGKNVLVPDDIIDGGRSIIMLSDRLKDMGCKNIDVFATHGIFSKGLDVFANVNHIFTTNSLLHYKKYLCDKLTILDCIEKNKII